MTRIGTLNDWARFLDAHSDDEAVGALARYVERIDVVYEELAVARSRLLDSPTGEVAEALTVAGTCLAEAIGMLNSVAERFRAGEREIA